MSEKIVLIDGHSILNRAFHGLPDLTNSAGLHTNAVYGFLTMLFKILDEEQPEYLTVAFDVHAPTFRHKMYDAYKGTRKPMAEELRQQVPVIKEVLRAMGIVVVEQEGYEADDLLGTLAGIGERAGLLVSIVSGDRDLLQLATDRTRIRIPKTKKTGTVIEDYYAEDVRKKCQVTPKEFIDVKALMGDSSDNIPGVPGIGKVTAETLIATYKSIENAYAHAEEIGKNRTRENLKEYYDQAVMSKALATIKTDCDITYHLEEARLGNLYTPEAFRLFTELEFKNLLGRFQKEDGAADQAGQSTWQAPDVKKVTELDEAERLFEQAGQAEQIGFLFVAGEDGTLLGLALFVQEEAHFLAVGGFLTPGYLAGKLAALLALDSAEEKQVLPGIAEEIGKLSGAAEETGKLPGGEKEKRGPLGVTLELKAQLIFLPEEFRSGSGMKQLRDAKIGAYLLNPLKGSYPYEDLAKDYCGQIVPGRETLLGKKSLTEAYEEEEETFLSWAGLVVSTAYHSMEPIEVKLAETGMKELYEQVEMPLCLTLFDMEQTGVIALPGELHSYSEMLAEQIAKVEAKIYEEAGETFNLNSTKQLGAILFEKLGLPNKKKTKTGYSTSADVLEKLAPDYPIVDRILTYRQLAKLKSTYADGLAAYIREDGRIHTRFHQTITATGRISSTEPNLQNIPIRMELGRQIRKVFVPAKGFVFLDADYSQIELRVLAHMSQDANLIDAFRKEEDIHRITAAKVFHVPMDEVTDLQRRSAKAVNFGIVYGISSFGLSQDLHISRNEASEYIREYFQTYPGVKAFLDNQVETAKEQGYVATYFGRRRPVPEILSDNHMQRSFGERIAMNSPIQGTAADIIKIAMIRVNRALKEQKLRSRLLLQVHDELLVETAEEEVTIVREILQREMEGAVSFAVDLCVDMKTGCNWLEAH